jgi:hypothetical protein
MPNKGHQLQNGRPIVTIKVEVAVTDTAAGLIHNDAESRKKAFEGLPEEQQRPDFARHVGELYALEAELQKHEDRAAAYKAYNNAAAMFDAEYEANRIDGGDYGKLNALIRAIAAYEAQGAFASFPEGTKDDVDVQRTAYRNAANRSLMVVELLNGIGEHDPVVLGDFIENYQEKQKEYTSKAETAELLLESIGGAASVPHRSD